MTTLVKIVFRTSSDLDRFVGLCVTTGENETTAIVGPVLTFISDREIQEMIDDFREEGYPADDFASIEFQKMR